MMLVNHLILNPNNIAKYSNGKTNKELANKVLNGDYNTVIVELTMYICGKLIEERKI